MSVLPWPGHLCSTVSISLRWLRYLHWCFPAPRLRPWRGPSVGAQWRTSASSPAAAGEGQPCFSLGRSPAATAPGTPPPGPVATRRPYRPAGRLRTSHHRTRHSLPRRRRRIEPGTLQLPLRMRRRRPRRIGRAARPRPAKRQPCFRLEHSPTATAPGTPPRVSGYPSTLPGRRTVANHASSDTTHRATATNRTRNPATCPSDATEETVSNRAGGPAAGGEGAALPPPAGGPFHDLEFPCNPRPRAAKLLDGGPGASIGTIPTMAVCEPPNDTVSFSLL